MAFDKGQPKEFDLDSTDKLPILEGISGVASAAVDGGRQSVDDRTHPPVVPALPAFDAVCAATPDPARVVEER